MIPSEDKQLIEHLQNFLFDYRPAAQHCSVEAVALALAKLIGDAGYHRDTIEPIPLTTEIYDSRERWNS